MAPILQRYGCYFLDGSNTCSLPTVQVEAHTTIFSTASRTKLTQTFSNPSPNDAIRDCIYSFPLYDGVSVVAFTCRVGSRLLCGVVKERGQARAVYDKAVPRGKAAGLFEQLKEASDVFSTRLGNVPSGESVIVEITYVGELKHDAEADGIRFTLPTKIAPRYWSRPDLVTSQGSTCTKQKGAFNITVDVSVAEGSSIQGIQCPSHPIAVTMSNISTHTDATPVLHRASATLSLKSTGLDKDFVLIVLAKSSNLPKGLLENHPTIQNQRALMVTLIPKFSLPPSRPEIIFLVDRSGSMSSKIPTLVSAMKVFLKSLPLGVKFNICSFGTFHSFLWQKSKLYSQDTLLESTSYVESFDASLGGTEIFTAIKASIESRYVDIPCEIMLLTDGEVWDQQEIFTYLNEAVNNSESGIRVFTLGVGNSVSHAFIEGIARAGNGFSQAVGEDEKLDSKVVRMLKGGLSPHVTDYSLEVKYEDPDSGEDDYELIDWVTDSLSVLLTEHTMRQEPASEKKPISLFDPQTNPDAMKIESPSDQEEKGRYSHLPEIPTPKVLQAPHQIPPLFPFTRSTVYLLMSPQAQQKNIRSVVLRATSIHGPLEIEIPIETLSEPGETIHQLAAKKAVRDLEEDRGWLVDAKDKNEKSVKQHYPGRYDEIVEREAVRLGVGYQVGGKFCSFVAVSVDEKNNKDRMTEPDKAGDVNEENVLWISRMVSGLFLVDYVIRFLLVVFWDTTIYSYTFYGPTWVTMPFLEWRTRII